MDDEQVKDFKLGTIQSAYFEVSENQNNKYYAIDNHFLKYLLMNDEITKCTALTYKQNLPDNGVAIKTSNSDNIYKDYSEKLPTLVIREFANDFLKKQSCYNSAGDIVILKDTTESFILESTFRGNEFPRIELQLFCQELGFQYKLSLKEYLEYINMDCTSSKYLGGNDLYKLYCDNLPETISLLGNLEDLEY